MFGIAQTRLHSEHKTSQHCWLHKSFFVGSWVWWGRGGGGGGGGVVLVVVCVCGGGGGGWGGGGGERTCVIHNSEKDYRFYEKGPFNVSLPLIQEGHLSVSGERTCTILTRTKLAQ